ncbi:MAG TPA: anti-sigma factor [Gemmatimonadaceae bacterium]|nr:anti-sigma factor [Gemmatimonadaceae bacterium]
MMREMGHDEARASLEAAALDALDSPEREAVLAHAATCAECGAELSELRAVAANLALAASSGGVDVGSRERIRARLLARAATDRTEEIPVATAPTATGLFRAVNALAWRRGEWLAAAASVLLVLSVAVLAALLNEREHLRDALSAERASAAATRTATDSLRLAVSSRDSLIAGLTGRDVAVMTLTASGARSPFARMFWDRATNRWTFVAHDMPPLPGGKTYQLWLVTASAKISAGTFEPRNGDAVVRATYAMPADSLKAIAVTEEPAGGVPQPTGRMVIAGGR